MTSDYEESEDTFNVELTRHEYRPGDEVEGSVEWAFSEPAGDLCVRLLLEFHGPEEQKQYAAGLQWRNLPAEGICNFLLRLPEGPYSYLGNRIQIYWSVDVEFPDWGFQDEVEFTYSPTGVELQL